MKKGINTWIKNIWKVVVWSLLALQVSACVQKVNTSTNDILSNDVNKKSNNTNIVTNNRDSADCLEELFFENPEITDHYKQMVFLIQCMKEKKGVSDED